MCFLNNVIILPLRIRAAHECRSTPKTSKSSIPILLKLSTSLSLLTRVDIVGSALFTIAKPVQAAVADREDVEEEQIHACMSMCLKACVYLIAHCFSPGTTMSAPSLIRFWFTPVVFLATAWWGSDGKARADSLPRLPVMDWGQNLSLHLPEGGFPVLAFHCGSTSQPHVSWLFCASCKIQYVVLLRKSFFLKKSDYMFNSWQLLWSCSRRSKGKNKRRTGCFIINYY